MENLENQVQKYIVNLSQYLRIHVDKWRSAIQDTSKPIQNLQNLVEQMACIDKVNLDYLENFNEYQQIIKYQITCRIEEDLTVLKEIIDELNRSNHDLKNKTFLLEKSTVHLDWDGDGPLIRGTGIQPPLSKILEYSLDFLNFFNKCSRMINDCYKSFRPNNKATVDKLQSSFKINLDDRQINYFLALTQYICNEKLLT